NSGFTGQLSLNNSFTLPNGFSAELSGFYISRQKQGYFVLEQLGSVSAGIRKSLLDNKLMISLNANDIFHTMTEKLSVQYDSVNYKLVGKRDSRRVSLSIRYNFGSQTVKASRSRSSGIEDEAGRAR
ncbi:MAG: outer membrane beta-barrel family protein, partial [Tannerella sp.]|nr:outer membrane beta-barrel family protein [Tannerella sp.]